MSFNNCGERKDNSWKNGICQYEDPDTGDKCGVKYERKSVNSKYCPECQKKIGNNYALEISNAKLKALEKKNDREEIRACQTKIYGTFEYSPPEREQGYFVMANQDSLREILKLKEWECRMKSDLAKLSEDPKAKMGWVGFN